MTSADSDNKIKERYKVWFFAGGETRDNKFNIFTGSFINMMKLILEEDFDFIKGIYFSLPPMNVIWALNNAQKPIINPDKQRITSEAFRQITTSGLSHDTQLVIVSSSSGEYCSSPDSLLPGESKQK